MAANNGHQVSYRTAAADTGETGHTAGRAPEDVAPRRYGIALYGDRGQGLPGRWLGDARFPDIHRARSFAIEQLLDRRDDVKDSSSPTGMPWAELTREVAGKPSDNREPGAARVVSRFYLHASSGEIRCEFPLEAERDRGDQ